MIANRYRLCTKSGHRTTAETSYPDMQVKLERGKPDLRIAYRSRAEFPGSGGGFAKWVV